MAHRFSSKDISPLPAEGFVRLGQVLRHIPISRTSWLAGVKCGIYPAPVKLGVRVTAWRVEDIREFIKQAAQGGVK